VIRTSSFWISSRRELSSHPQSSLVLSDECPGLVAALPPSNETASDRRQSLVREHLRFVWRLIRRIGLAASDADDVTQRVFSIAVQRIESIQLGSERAFLYRTAVRLAIRFHASKQRQRKLDSLEAIESLQDPTPSPDTLLDQQRARQLFDQILASMALELRTVIILFELENLTLTEIAETLRIPRGTAASRLRRAREEFDLGVRRIETRLMARRGAR